MLGNRLGQGIDISFNMDMGMSMVEGCTVVGGQEGITTHSSMTDIMGNTVSRTTGEAISIDEMSMGMASHNTVRDALGVGLYCNDRSMCMFDHNTVVGTRPDAASGDRGARLRRSSRASNRRRISGGTGSRRTRPAWRRRPARR